MWSSWWRASQPVLTDVIIYIHFLFFMNCYVPDASQMFTKIKSFNSNSFKIRIKFLIWIYRAIKHFFMDPHWMHLFNLSSAIWPWRVFLLWFLSFVWLFFPSLTAKPKTDLEKSSWNERFGQVVGAFPGQPLGGVLCCYPQCGLLCSVMADVFKSIQTPFFTS